MDYLLVAGIRKMPKIPEKNIFYSFLINHIEKRFQLKNLILLNNYEN